MEHRYLRSFLLVAHRTTVTLGTLAWGCGLLSAQLNYTFSASSGTFTPLTAGTAVPEQGSARSFLDNDVMSDPIPIGFAFGYDGTTYTTVRVSTEGFLLLKEGGQGGAQGNPNNSNSATNNSAFANTGGTLRPMIAPLWDDMAASCHGTPSSAQYATTGTAPDRVFTVEWRNWRWGHDAQNPVISFQCKLYETTNIIEFIYQRESGSVVVGSASIGLIGRTPNAFLSLQSTGTAPAVSSTVAKVNLNTKPASGQRYRFTPSCSTPASATILSNSSPICLGSTLALEGGAGGTKPLTMAWSGTGTFSAPNAAVTTVSNAATGNYTLTVRNWCGQAASAIAPVTIATPPSANAGADKHVCSADGSIALAAAVPAQGQGRWSQVSGALCTLVDPASPNATVSDLSSSGARIFRWTVTNTPCPVAMDEMTVQVDLSPSATISGGGTICSDAGPTPDVVKAFSGEAPYTFTYSDGASTHNVSGQLDPTYVLHQPAPGVYRVLSISHAGCTDNMPSDGVSVAIVPTPHAGDGQRITVCSNAPALELSSALSAHDATGTWDLNGDLHDGTFIPGEDTPGTYRYTVDNGAPCAADTALVIVQVDQATAWYLDADGDGYGAGAPNVACTAPVGAYLSVAGDDCPLLAGRRGDACNDGDPFTANDVITADCTCRGIEIPSHYWTLRLMTDGAGTETSWELFDVDSSRAIASGNGYPNNAVTDETIRVPDGHRFTLKVFDSGNNGMGNAGGYVLMDHTGARIIDNTGNGAFTSLSQSPEGFSSTVGTVALRTVDCDNLERWPFDMIMATPDPAVSAQWQVGDQTDDGYEFWFFEPNGSYSRRIFRNHATSGGYAPADATRACKLGLASWVTAPLPENTLLNVRVRGRVNGTNQAWGPACRLKIDQAAANCRTTQLENTPGTTLSCGAIGLKTNGSSRIWAKPVIRYVRATNTNVNANRYRFHCTNVGENVSFDIVLPSYAMLIYPQYGFRLGATYSVTVQASFDYGATYCAYGPACSISFATTNLSRAENAPHADGLLLWPVPNNGEQVHVRMQGDAQQASAEVEVSDLLGKSIQRTTLPTTDGLLDATFTLDNGLAEGLYLVTVTIGTNSTTQRLQVRR